MLARIAFNHSNLPQHKKKNTTEWWCSFLAESVRFELTVGFPITSFQDWLLKPLGQLSIDETIPFYNVIVKNYIWW